jgi:hypothetical protein
MFLLFWNGSEEEGRNHFKRFFDIGKHAPDFDLAGANEMLRQGPS